MKNASLVLLRMMIMDEGCAEFMQKGWLILYNDIIASVGTGKLHELDELSKEAILSWYQHLEKYGRA